MKMKMSTRFKGTGRTNRRYSSAEINIGDRFYSLVVHHFESNGNGRIVTFFKCDCGKIVHLSPVHIFGGKKIKSCGCLRTHYARIARDEKSVVIVGNNADAPVAISMFLGVPVAIDMFSSGNISRLAWIETDESEI